MNLPTILHGQDPRLLPFIALALLSPLFSPAIGLFAGLAFALSVGNPLPALSKKLSKQLLQYSVIGLGFGMNLHEALASGRDGMLFTIVSVSLIMVLGWVIGRRLKLSDGTAYLIAAGTAICGGSAIAAVSPLTRSSESEISVSLATIFVLNAVALFIFPPLGHYFGLTDQQFGIWAAMAIHDTSSVVGAGAAYSETALKVATTVKLTRALWIIPLAFVTTLIFRDRDAKIQIPWFIFFFVLAMVANTYVEIPVAFSHAVVWVSKKALVLTLFLIGAALSRDVLRQVGLRPMLLGVLLWAIIGSASLAVLKL
ncbi:YeiH family protein [Crenobacter caeni]|uniref:Putative sulfate exporter family transporter n=1 Tax=Crenobacter caeni TaxID=2705474 RepID=A0A6B2KTL2_9NEIS|nr:putative sulfate exporter family transporter [Crenobacter caeni]NDV13488.1 putative sulfate exporter family transporter [Crenobacter caeni]